MSRPLEAFAEKAVQQIVYAYGPGERVERMQALLVFVFWRGLIIGAIASVLLCAAVMTVLHNRSRVAEHTAIDHWYATHSQVWLKSLPLDRERPLKIIGVQMEAFFPKVENPCVGFVKVEPFEGNYIRDVLICKDAAGSKPDSYMIEGYPGRDASCENETDTCGTSIQNIWIYNSERADILKPYGTIGSLSAAWGKP